MRVLQRHGSWSNVSQPSSPAAALEEAQAQRWAATLPRVMVPEKKSDTPAAAPGPPNLSRLSAPQPASVAAMGGTFTRTRGHHQRSPSGMRSFQAVEHPLRRASSNTTLKKARTGWVQGVEVERLEV